MFHEHLGQILFALSCGCGVAAYFIEGIFIKRAQKKAQLENLTDDALIHSTCRYTDLNS